MDTHAIAKLASSSSWGVADGDGDITQQQVQGEIDSAVHPMLESTLVDHTIQFLRLGDFVRSARVSKLWHDVTISGANGSHVWKRGVRRGGEIRPGKQLAFWSTMTNFRNCISDPLVGSLASSLREYHHAMASGEPRRTMFDHNAGGDLAFDRRKGVYTRMKKWATSTKSTDWKIALESKISGTISRFRRRLGMSVDGVHLDALFDRVAVVANAYVGFVSARDVVNATSLSQETPSLHASLASLSSTLNDISGAKRTKDGVDDPVAKWLNVVAQAVPLLTIFLWGTQHYSSFEHMPGVQSLTQVVAAYDGGDALVRDIEDEDAFWSLAVLRESQWFDLQNFRPQKDFEDLRELLLKFTPKIIAHLDSHSVGIASFVSEWIGSGFTCLCTPGATLFHIWDIVVTEGRKCMYRVVIQVLLDCQSNILEIDDSDRLLDYLSGHRATGARIIDTKNKDGSFVQRMLSLKVTHSMISALVVRAGKKMSVRNLLPASSKAPTKAVVEPLDTSAEWRTKLTLGSDYTMPPAPAVNRPDTFGLDTSDANLSGVSPKLRHEFFEKVEKVQEMMRRPIQIGSVSSRLIHRLGIAEIGSLLSRLNEDSNGETVLKELKELVILEEISIKLEDRIPVAKPNWPSDKVKACANFIMQDNSLPALISLTTSRSRLQHVISAFDEAANNGKNSENASLQRLKSIKQIMQESQNAEPEDLDVSREKLKTKRRADARRRSIIARVPISEESYYIEPARGSPKDRLEGPFSRKEMCYWCDKRVVGPTSLLRVVVTNPQNFVLHEDLGPGVFKDDRGSPTSICPFSADVDNAPTYQARSLFPEWFSAFRMVPEVPKFESLSSPGVVAPPPPPRRESYYTSQADSHLSTASKQTAKIQSVSKGEKVGNLDQLEGVATVVESANAQMITSTMSSETGQESQNRLKEERQDSESGTSSLNQMSTSEESTQAFRSLKNELNLSKQEVAKLHEQLASLREQSKSESFLKSEIAKLKSVVESSGNTISHLEIALMEAKNRADELAMQKKYDEEEVTSIVETYRKNATDAKAQKLKQDAKIQKLISEMEDSFLLERENDKLGNLLAEMTSRGRDLEAKLEKANMQAQELAVENIKLKKKLRGQAAYYEKVASELDRRDVSIMERERRVAQREHEAATNAQQEFLRKLSRRNAKRMEDHAKIQREFSKNVEDIRQKLLDQFGDILERQRMTFAREKGELLEEHAAAAGRWDVERSRLEQRVHDEHAVSTIFV